MAHSGRAEPRSGADALQRPLRSRFRARLTASVGLPHFSLLALRKMQYPLDTRDIPKEANHER